LLDAHSLLLVLECFVDFFDAIFVLDVFDHGRGTARPISVVLHHDVLDLRDDGHFSERAGLWNGAQRVGTVPRSLKSVDAQAELTHYTPDLVVLAFVQLHVQPCVCVLTVLDFNVVRPVLPIVHHDSISQLLKFLLVKLTAEDAHSIRTLNCVVWHFKCLGELTIICDD